MSEEDYRIIKCERCGKQIRISNITEAQLDGCYCNDSDYFDDPYYEQDGEDGEENSCLYGYEFCAYHSYEHMLEEMRNTFLKRILNKISKKRKERLEEIYRTISSFAVDEYCNFVCEMKVRK